ncbi:MAG TPA: glycosyltransferase family 2 protein [Pyrinomonadaceae bacterium]|nr:glycosyltransferase family 2 protein [Pyrinomonadaceae bacterium]
MERPSVSVVIATHNRRAFLAEAVASVRAQTFERWELLVVDDASEDDTWEWLTREREHDERLRIFRLAENSQRAVAANHALAEARGEFIMFLDDDDLLRPEALAQLAEALRQDESAVAAAGARFKFKESGQGVRINHPSKPVKKIIWPELLHGSVWSAVSGQTLYHTEKVRQVGGYPPGVIVVDDRTLWLRIARLGPVLILPSIVLDYRTHDGQWRPHNIQEMRKSVFEDFMAGLRPHELRRARRYRRSGEWSRAADEEFERGNYRAALAGYLRACRAAPTLLLSPLIGRRTINAIKSSLRGLLSHNRPGRGQRPA